MLPLPTDNLDGLGDTVGKERAKSQVWVYTFLKELG